ncbi:ribosome maturation factor RimP [Legionella sp. CNM-4043-24]|uniref:ribosome maturation factor RimP n=1 Tax=Legionella sp. CNM-4043-24 TaxID=3421646 RepID=UPI00403AC893
MIREDIQELFQPVVTELGYQLWGCEYLPQGKHSLLRVYIDKEGGVGIGDCEIVSREVSALLDVEDPISGNYSLEVSSPGLSRPLFFIEHYQQYIGHSVQLKLYKPINGSRKLVAVIESVSDEAIFLSVGNEEIEVQFSQIVKANLTGE